MLCFPLNNALLTLGALKVPNAYFCQFLDLLLWCLTFLFLALFFDLPRFLWSTCVFIALVGWSVDVFRHTHLLASLRIDLLRMRCFLCWYRTSILVCRSAVRFAFASAFPSLRPPLLANLRKFLRAYYISCFVFNFSRFSVCFPLLFPLGFVHYLVCL